MGLMMTYMVVLQGGATENLRAADAQLTRSGVLSFVDERGVTIRGYAAGAWESFRAYSD